MQARTVLAAAAIPASIATGAAIGLTVDEGIKKTAESKTEWVSTAGPIGLTVFAAAASVGLGYSAVQMIGKHNPQLFPRLRDDWHMASTTRRLSTVAVAAMGLATLVAAATNFFPSADAGFTNDG
jgi:hypothetical protein